MWAFSANSTKKIRQIKGDKHWKILSVNLNTHSEKRLYRYWICDRKKNQVKLQWKVICIKPRQYNFEYTTKRASVNKC